MIEKQHKNNNYLDKGENNNNYERIIEKRVNNNYQFLDKGENNKKANISDSENTLQESKLGKNLNPPPFPSVEKTPGIQENDKNLSKNENSSEKKTDRANSCLFLGCFGKDI